MLIFLRIPQLIISIQPYYHNDLSQRRVKLSFSGVRAKNPISNKSFEITGNLCENSFPIANFLLKNFLCRVRVNFLPFFFFII